MSLGGVGVSLAAGVERAGSGMDEEWLTRQRIKGDIAGLKGIEDRDGRGGRGRNDGLAEVLQGLPSLQS